MEGKEKTLAVANYFLQQGFKEGIEITPLKLQKLVYIAHGYYLAVYDQPLIDEPIIAATYGPLIDSLYHEFRWYSNEPITSFASIIAKEDAEPLLPKIEDAETKEFLHEVWEGYKEGTAHQLSAITHNKKTPWADFHHQLKVKSPALYAKVKDAWSPEENILLARIGNLEIPKESIGKYYKEKLNSYAE